MCSKLSFFSFGRWLAIPVVAIASFTLLGIEAIAMSIENPVGTDYVDLNLEYV
jgi:predicted membrane chloride channel (bestrophin family)